MSGRWSVNDVGGVHARRATRHRNFKCSSCNKTYFSKYAYENHIKLCRERKIR